ncbi:MAG: hypothetical protein ACI8UO_005392 [Verrucomicrobiales bacterium]|jgi:hypothetical protein
MGGVDLNSFAHFKPILIAGATRCQHLLSPNSSSVKKVASNSEFLSDLGNSFSGQGAPRDGVFVVTVFNSACLVDCKLPALFRYMQLVAAADAFAATLSIIFAGKPLSQVI